VVRERAASGADRVALSLTISEAAALPIRIRAGCRSRERTTWIRIDSWLVDAAITCPEE
jgi:hypothetical protein